MFFDMHFTTQINTQNAFFPADFILSSPQGISKGEIGTILLHGKQLHFSNNHGLMLYRRIE